MCADFRFSLYERAMNIKQLLIFNRVTIIYISSIVILSKSIGILDKET